MKALLLLLAISMSVPVLANVDGNGGGGVNQNGVYKTFYSAGVYVSPEAESEIPGAELYTKTILTLAGKNESTSKLLALGLPIAHRKFYKILEDKMDAVVMERLISEYARIVDQPAANLTIFAITDIRSHITYLLPTFYKLSEVEQAAILFHEAYWILNPRASYSQVVAAESSFQKFVESKNNGKFDTELVRLLGDVMSDQLLPLKTAFSEDARKQTAPALITKEGNIKLKNIFAGNTDLCSNFDYRMGDSGKKTVFGKEKRVTFLSTNCTLSFEHLQQVLELSRKYPKSFFLKELMRFISLDYKIQLKGVEMSELTENKEAALARIFDKSVKFERVFMDSYYSERYASITMDILNK